MNKMMISWNKLFEKLQINLKVFQFEQRKKWKNALRGVKF